MGKRKGTTPDDVAIIVMEPDADTLIDVLEEAQDDLINARLESVEIGEPIFLEDLATPIVPESPDFTSTEALFPDPSSPTGWRDANGTPVDPETGERFDEEDDGIPF